MPPCAMSKPLHISRPTIIRTLADVASAGEQLDAERVCRVVVGVELGRILADGHGDDPMASIPAVLIRDEAWPSGA